MALRREMIKAKPVMRYGRNSDENKLAQLSRTGGSGDDEIKSTKEAKASQL